MADAKEVETVSTGPPAYNEKIEDSTAKHNEFREDTGRRQSVALNIVENPLKVSAAFLRCKAILGITC
jgi:hypothetical protein